MQDAGDLALTLLKYSAEYFTKHAFYTATQVSLTAIFTVFLLYSPVQREFSPVMEGVFGSMETYLKLKTYISLLMGITNGIFLALVGFELPAAWGLLTFLVNFIPNLGGPSISIISCLIALLDSRKTLTQVAAGFGAQFFLHFNIANFVEPIVFGTTEAIHGVVILLGLSFFGYIWGITGMFLSVPLLFAAHSYLLIISQSRTSSLEAREDARFIMGMLEGQWLAEEGGIGAIDSAEHGMNVVVGSMEARNSSQIMDDQVLPSGPTPPPGTLKAGSGEESGQVIDWLTRVAAVRDSETNAVLLQGLFLRWVLVLSVSCCLYWFQPSELIHPNI
eukprot:TRINITY_DN11677_c0_g1_i2.p1 TRINITY_DN11677_c0_g1~~TRINITY_DN11677_c0_g1_i2.p1  ORF type:complete len:389 (-),score=65.87 TRINITY_DN11677_c0_g1_i2:56-1054(-)